MWTLLFDIDGTLIQTGGAGMIAIRRAMQELFQLDETKIERVPVHGRTDRAIIGDIFRQFDLETNDHWETFNSLYWEYLPETLQQCEGAILPGVQGLLKSLSERSDVSLGILTGNSKEAARIKLAHFELLNYFHFGGYGDLHEQRNDVARSAFDHAVATIGEPFCHERLWVIGDTVNDITCARSINSKVIAVETGGGESTQALRAAAPDGQLVSLSSKDEFFELIFSGD